MAKEKNVYQLIKKASEYQSKTNFICEEIAKEAKKYFDWCEIQCEVKAGDGVTLFYEMYVCPASRFFEYVKTKGINNISEEEFRCLCI